MPEREDRPGNHGTVGTNRLPCSGSADLLDEGVRFDLVLDRADVERRLPRRIRDKQYEGILLRLFKRGIERKRKRAIGAFA